MRTSFLFAIVLLKSLLSCTYLRTYVWRFERISRFECVKTGLILDGGAPIQFDSRRLHHF